jgi:hypothetical protein
MLQTALETARAKSVSTSLGRHGRTSRSCVTVRDGDEMLFFAEDVKKYGPGGRNIDSDSTGISSSSLRFKGRLLKRPLASDTRRTSTRLCILLRSARSLALGNNMLTLRTFLVSPPFSAPPHACTPPPACTANFCVCFFYRPTRRYAFSTGPPGDRGTSLPLECHRNTPNQTRSGTNARQST